MAIVNYDEWHQQYKHDDDDQSVWHVFIKRVLKKDNLENKVVLEIGCGRGGLSNHIRMASPPPAKLFACDYSADAIEMAKEKYGADQVQWQCEDIQAMSFGSNFFDRIISCETIEHVPDPRKAVLELFRVLKPGGKLYLTCPNYFNFFGLWCMYRWIIGKPYTEGQPYVNYLLLPRLLNWIKHAGFYIEKYHTSNLVFPLRAHYHFYKNDCPFFIRWLGFRTYFVLCKT